ncbi:MAG: B12-binding domain-containing protein, partial [Ignisphaera sp.]
MDLGSKINALDNVLNAIVNLDLDSISILCRNAVELDIGIQDIVNTVARAMEVVGRKYEEGEYFLSELIVA